MLYSCFYLAIYNLDQFEWKIKTTLAHFNKEEEEESKEMARFGCSGSSSLIREKGVVLFPIFILGTIHPRQMMMDLPQNDVKE